MYECLKRKENGADVVVLFTTVFGARQGQVQLLLDTSCVLFFKDKIFCFFLNTKNTAKPSISPLICL